MAQEKSSYDYNDPRSQPSRAGNVYFEAQNQKLRDHSGARPSSTMSESGRYPPPQKPVDEAVTSAFDRAETPNHVPPELIAQITQNVIKQLQTGGIDAGTPVPPTQNPFSPPPQHIHQPVPQSPSTASGTSPNMPNRVYTPPSPQKHPDYPSHTSPQSQSGYLPDSPPSPKESRAANTSSRRSSSPLSLSSDISEKVSKRPRGPSRLSTGKEETTLERIWGQLFDEEGHSTVRLGQFLRGLAVHIIEDYEPRHSIVITPTKMVRYYDDVKLSNEIYPWSTVFDDEHSSISRMYRDLECQHHLVQERLDERPDIPGLTPVGFQRWVTLLIQAHPEEEFERLQKAVLEMPISNPDDKKERFPKEISRRLFPGHEDTRIRHRIEDSIAEHAAVEIPKKRPSPDPLRDHHEEPSHKPSVAEQSYVPQSHRPSVSFADQVLSSTSTLNSNHAPPTLERERKPYSNVPESAIDDTNPPLPPSNPIERERKPYSALPGGGKQFEDENRPREATKPRSESTALPRPTRSDSKATRPIPINNTQRTNMDVPKPEIHHHRAPSNVAGGRHRSPSFSRGTTNDFRRPDSDIRGYQPSFEPSSVPHSEAVFDESDTRRYFEKNARERAERARRQADEDSRAYGDSPRRDFDRDERARPKRGDYLNDEDYYRAGGRGDRGNGYDYQQPFRGPAY